MRWLLLVLLSSMVVMCGQKGPLELPEPEARMAAAPVANFPQP